MRACSTAGGGVMFIPDTLERKKRKLAYSDIAGASETEKTESLRAEQITSPIMVEEEQAIQHVA